ncbi:hypothetical protein SAMN04488518_10478 [Pseudovibrio ascidiaceicola]|uniref:Uncharacterized protein n=1 Tax=Pseudovibrio ascidiaceicola TaxID=285279 RepID=A0A1I3YLF9_9HYPH|nr:hypothetical protein [Pseudovibrio ascidiaceicola]SFK32189.1 hypothetical protein SAMN04488518_10478 [Pseudovibrio ascidiaceicola]
MKLLKRLSIGVLCLVLVIGVGAAAPILYVEQACTSPQVADNYQSLLEPAHRREEARSFLTYPEWHIVYAYEDYAATLANGMPHDFNYLNAIGSFWSSLCALKSEADTRGAAQFDTKATIYTIGVSFSFEMLMKAAYEETLGRLAAATSTNNASLQDQLEYSVSADYAKFLHQTPWYRFDFEGARQKLNAATTDDGVRSWERWFALNLEWWAKAQYAKAIATAVDTIGHDELTMQSVISSPGSQDVLSEYDLEVIQQLDDKLIIQTPRYRKFTELVLRLSQDGVMFHEIAGNDDILISALTGGSAKKPSLSAASILSETERNTGNQQRLLIESKVPALSRTLQELAQQGVIVEHIYDY